MAINIDELKNKIAEVVGKKKKIYRLSDVLLAISKSNKKVNIMIPKLDGSWLLFGNKELGGSPWDLSDNNLDHQSKECKRFLEDLLVK